MERILLRLKEEGTIDADIIDILMEEQKNSQTSRVFKIWELTTDPIKTAFSWQEARRFASHTLIKLTPSSLL